RHQVVAAGGQLELVAPVFGPRVFAVAGIERFLLAVRHDLEPTFVDALAGEITLGRRRAPVPEGEVVFVAPALVAVPGDPDLDRGVGAQNRSLAVEDALIG